MTRIIAGKAGGRRLDTPAGVGTRPTADRVREALFSRLEHLGAMLGADVLDLYERHLEFLHMQSDLPGTSDLSDNAEPVREWSDDYAKEDS